ncbi:MAG TPA: DUF308 domain-containing protein [Hanamia sp.]|jgi:uncharacterized membrane protein HdeD (DUF308 family)|nr:DUF308 domain-containing protein [Hanamia sp.]
MIKSKNWWLITIKGLIFIFLGFYILRFPISGMLGLIIYGSIALFISGLILATFAVITRKVHKGWGWQMAEGILDIILAVILLLNIGLTAITLPYVFAFYGILTGIFWIFQSFFFKSNQYKFWGVVLLAGLLSLLVGILILLNPLIAVFTIVAIIGIMFIVQGFFLTLFSFEISRAHKVAVNDSLEL